MQRRDFIACSAMLLTAPHIVWAQGAKPKVRLGMASFGVRSDRMDGYSALFERLAELGYIEGKNLEVDFTANVNPEQLPNAFTRAVRRGASILFASGHDITLFAAQLASGGRVPIVFIAMDYDPVNLGYVQSIPHPGVNRTGIFVRQPELAAKRVELAHEALPEVRRMVLWQLANYREQVDAASSAAAALGLETSKVEMNGNPRQSYIPVFDLTANVGPSAVILPASNQVRTARAEICRLALERRIPLIAAEREIVEAGALMSYGIRIDKAYREAADYIDRIARGEKASDLPLMQPTRFELAVNARTAKALSITLPPDFLARVDQLIE
jgi:putative tryptophan/tyrosine transport system substrate-binding protein